MEPSYSYDQSAMSSEMLQAVGMARGFDPDAVRHPFFNQQPKQHPFYPDTSGQHTSWPTPVSQPFPHPFSPQAYGPFSPGMQAYGAYTMGQNPYGSYFSDQQSYSPLPPAQQLVPPHSAMQLYSSDTRNETKPSPSSMNPKTFDSSLAERQTPSLNAIDQKMSEQNSETEAPYAYSTPTEKVVGDPGMRDNDVAQSGGQDEKRFVETPLSDNKLATQLEKGDVFGSVIANEGRKFVKVENDDHFQMGSKKPHLNKMDRFESLNQKVLTSQAERIVKGEMTGDEVDTHQVHQQHVGLGLSRVDTAFRRTELRRNAVLTRESSGPQHATKDQPSDEEQAEIKEEPTDKDTSGHSKQSDGGSLESLFPNLASSCNEESAEFASTRQSSEIGKSDKGEKSDKTEASDQDPGNLSVSESISTSPKPDRHKGPGQGGDGLPEIQPSVPPGAFPSMPLPMMPQMEAIMAGMLTPNLTAAQKSADSESYTCPVCGKQLSDAGILARHLKIHSGESQHVCELCDQSFLTATELKKHIRSHTGDKPYACTKCERMFYDNSSLRRHMLYHSGEKRHRCHICGRAFAQVGNLRVHLKGKHAEPSAFFNCSACDARFDRQKELKAHLKTHVIGAPPKVLNQYGIDVNWIAPPSQADLPNTAVGNKPSSIDSASSSDDSKQPAVAGTDNAQKLSITSEHDRDGTSSVMSSGGQDIPIPAPAAFTPEMGITAANMAASGGMALPNNMPSPADMAAVAAAVIANQPVSSKPGYVIKDGVLFFVCVVCLEEFSETQAFKAHMRTHKINRPLPKLPCPVPGCHAILTGNSTFRRHLKTHTGARPHQCPECNKSFVHAADLTKHRRIHTDDRPFVCSQCKRGFHDSSSLRRHHFWHTGQKPYACPFCHKPFSHTGKLGAHMQSVHNADPDERYNCEYCPKSFCSVATVDKHITNKHADQFPNGYTPGSGARLGGVINKDAENSRTATAVKDSVKPPIKELSSAAVKANLKPKSKPSCTDEPVAKKSKSDTVNESRVSVASNDDSNVDSYSNPSHSESNSQLDADSDSNVASGSNMSKDQPPFEASLRKMVSQLFSRMKQEQGDETGSNVSDSSDDEEEEDGDEEVEEEDGDGDEEQDEEEDDSELSKGKDAP